MLQYLAKNRQTLPYLLASYRYMWTLKDPYVLIKSANPSLFDQLNDDLKDIIVKDVEGFYNKDQKLTYFVSIYSPEVCTYT